MVLNNFAKKIAVVVSAVFISASLFAAKIPEYKGRVNDYANVISKSDEAEIEGYLQQLDEQTGVQLMVLTIPSMDGDDIASYSMKVAEKWGTGHSGKDNGVLLVVAMEEHDLRIEVGYGLEDKLTDAKCGLIIRNVMIPEFKNGNYSDGIVKGVRNIAGVASDNAELISKRVQNDDEDESGIEGIVFLVIWMIFFFAIISSKGGIWKWFFISRMLGGNSRGPYRGPTHTTHTTFTGPSNRSNFGGGFSSGGGGFHTGGGHFGGGGASGHW